MNYVNTRFKKNNKMKGLYGKIKTDGLKKFDFFFRETNFFKLKDYKK